MEPELREHAMEIGKGNGRCERGRRILYNLSFSPLPSFYGSDFGIGIQDGTVGGESWRLWEFGFHAPTRRVIKRRQCH